MQTTSEIKALLEWQLAMGVDEAIADAPKNHLLAPEEPPKAAIQPPKIVSTTSPARPAARAEPSASLAETIAAAEKAAKQATTLAELKAAIEGFDGCPLKRTARNTVFADGAEGSDIMIIGEAPSADEDRQGIPFCGDQGQLLDKMLAAIGLNRAENCYITNALFWRPPGNRTATPEELAICRPFAERHIALFAPKLLIFVGGMPAKMLLEESRGINKLRGEALSFGQTPARALFHPAFLMRQPQNKKQAWQDLLAIRAIIDDITA